MAERERDPAIDKKASSQCSELYAEFHNPESYRNPVIDRKGWCIAAKTPNGRMYAITRTGIGLFNSRMDAERAIVGLKSEGVTTLMQLRELGFQKKLAEALYKHQCW